MVEIILPLENQQIKSAPTKKLNILVVDDDNLVSQVLCIHLEKIGHNTSNVDNAHTALQIIKQSSNAWDLIITDEIMPKMRGSKLLTIIKEKYPNIKVIIYSGFSEHLNEQQAIKLGAEALWHKPLDYNLVEQEIKKLAQ